MKQRKMEYVIGRRYRKIDKLFKKVSRNFDEDDIHDFRVEVKKLRAFLHLIGGGSGAVGIKLPKRLRQFYRAAGEIRHMQLQEREIQLEIRSRDVILPDDYLQYLTRQKAANIELAREIGRGGLKKDGIYRKLPERITPVDMKLFVESKAGMFLDTQKSPSMTEETLHEVRKALKDILYISAFMKEDAADVLYPTFFNNREEIERVTALLGDLQDLRSRLQLLQSPYLRLVTLPEARESLKEMKTSWLQQKAAIRKEINDLIRDKAGQIKSNHR